MTKRLLNRITFSLASTFGFLVASASPKPTNALETKHTQSDISSFMGQSHNLLGHNFNLKSLFNNYDETRVFETFSVGQSYLGSLQTGDLVFFTRPKLSLKPLQMILHHLERYANGRDGEHIGIIMRHPIYDYPYVVELTWRGIQVTAFEDRVLHSSCEDIMVRSLHAHKPQGTDQKALEFVETLLKEQDANRNPVKIAAGWLITMSKMFAAGWQASWAAREAPPVKRMNDKLEEEKRKAQKQLQQQQQNNPTQNEKTAISPSLQFKDEDSSYTETYLHGRRGALDVSDHGALPNAVGLLGELEYVTGILERTYTKIDNITLELNQNDDSTSSSSSSLTSSSFFSPSSLPSKPSTMEKEVNTQRAALAMLKMRQRFLETRIRDLVKDVSWTAIANARQSVPIQTWIRRQKEEMTQTAETDSSALSQQKVTKLHSKGFNMTHFPTFPNAVFVAQILQHINMLPPNNCLITRQMDSIQGTNQDDRTSNIATDFEQTCSKRHGITSKSLEAADMLLHTVLEAAPNASASAAVPAEKWTNTYLKDPETGRIATSTLFALVKLRRRAQDVEYAPHNFRDNEHVQLVRGELGQEQYITQGYNPPPFIIIPSEAKE